MISYIEQECGKTGNKKYLPADLADIPESWVDIDHTQKLLWREPKIPIQEGVHQLIKRYREYYKI